MKNTATLLINCLDRKGLVARVSGLLYSRGASITLAGQHQDHEAALFFMRVAIFVSRQLHCLADLLPRREEGELVCEIPLIVGNHDEGRTLAEFCQVPFHCLETEAAQLELLNRHEIELIVFALHAHPRAGIRRAPP